MKLNEASAAFALEQLKKLPNFLKIRERNFIALKEYFSKYEEWLHVPYLIKGAKTNWLAFPLTIKNVAPFTRYNYLKHMEENGIQTRVMFSGNVTRHPAFKNVKKRIASLLTNSDKIMASGFLLGCHHGMSISDVHLITASSEDFFSRYS